MRIRAVVTGCLLLLATGASASAAQLAPQYQSSDPSAGAERHQAPDNVTVRFNEPLDESSRLHVLDSCGKRVDAGNTEVSGTEMSVGLERTPSGRYDVHYRAVGIGGITGTTEDSFHFTVHSGESCDGEEGGHGDHDPNEGGGHDPREGGGHEGDHDPSEGSGHDPNDHGSTTTSGHDNHPLGAGSMDHGEDKPKGEHEHAITQAAPNGPNHGKHAPEDAPSPVRESARTPGRPDAQAAAVALVLALALGALGGAFLRFTEPA